MSMVSLPSDDFKPDRNMSRSEDNIIWLRAIAG